MIYQNKKLKYAVMWTLECPFLIVFKTLLYYTYSNFLCILDTNNNIQSILVLDSVTETIFHDNYKKYIARSIACLHILLYYIFTDVNISAEMSVLAHAGTRANCTTDCTVHR